MKLVPETVYKIVNDDGTEVRPATAKKIKDIVQILRDAKILGDASPVANTVAMRIASAILSNYELRKRVAPKKGDSPQPLEQTDDDTPPLYGNPTTNAANAANEVEIMIKDE